MAWSSSMTLLAALLLSLALSKEASGSAELRVRLRRLTNFKGVGANGQCCDGRYFFCIGECDHKLTICLDRPEGPEDMSSCLYGRHITGEVTNQNYVVFGDKIGGTDNPMFFPMQKWPGTINLKVWIVDVDPFNTDDFVDYLSTNITFVPSGGAANYQTVIELKNRVSLNMEVSLSCLTNSFGTQCTGAQSAQSIG